jgi:Lon protease-like protein
MASQTLPLFPLHSVLFPGGLLPLQIFEQRYLDMTKLCIRDGCQFGVCRILEGKEVGAPAVHALIGCTASIAEWEMPHLGMFQLRTRGEQIFRVLKSRALPSGLIEAEVETINADIDLIAPPHLDLCTRLLEKIIERIGPDWYFAPARYDQPEWIANRLAEALPLSVESRQELLESSGVGARLSRLHALIVQSGMPPLAA